MITKYFYIYFSVFIAIAVLLFEMGMLRSFYGDEVQRDKKLKKRLQDLKRKTKAVQSQSILKDTYGDDASALALIPFYGALRTLIPQSGMDVSVNRVLLLQLILSVFVGFVAFKVTASFIVSVPLSILAGAAPYMVLTFKRDQRVSKFNDQFSDTVDIIIRALQAGHPFESAISVAAAELPDPIAEELTITSAEINYGVHVTVALQNMLQRVPSEFLKSLVSSVSIQKESGGNLAEILGKISEVIRAGYRFQRKLKTLSAEGRFSSIVMGAIPLVLAAFFFFKFPELMVYLTGTEMGHNALTLAAVLYTVGFLWVKALVKLEP